MNYTLDELDGSNDAYSRNTTPLPHPDYHLNNTPTRSNRSNHSNTRMRSNDNGNGFHLNVPNSFRSNATDYYNACSTFQASYNAESTPPAPFCDMRNVQQIVSWLCSNPDILLLAYNTHLSMHTPVTSTFSFTFPNHNQQTSATAIPQDKVKFINFDLYLSFFFVTNY
jgi:hypothetical protein